MTDHLYFEIHVAYAFLEHKLADNWSCSCMTQRAALHETIKALGWWTSEVTKDDDPDEVGLFFTTRAKTELEAKKKVYELCEVLKERHPWVKQRRRKIEACVLDEKPCPCGSWQGAHHPSGLCFECWDKSYEQGSAGLVVPFEVSSKALKELREK